MGRWIGADEASRRLGVKPATLYAYVSRGVLGRRKGEDGRSVFDAEEIERLALRGRPRRRPGTAAELVIESAVTLLGPDRAYYRGRDAIDLAATATYEAVVTWLWTGDPDRLPPAGGWVADPVAVAAARTAQEGLPPGVLPLERLQVITTALAAADPVRLTLDPAAVIRTGQALIAGLVDALPDPAGDPAGGRTGTTGGAPASAATARSAATATRGDGGGGGGGGDGPGFEIDGEPAGAPGGELGGEGAGEPGAGSPGAGPGIAQRLWGKLAGPGADPALADVLRFAMVLLADHELAASTLAARVAASVRADPYAVVAAGLGVTSGALHGGASLGVEAMLAEATDPSLAAAMMGQRLRRGERIPGFGHVVYRSGDARAAALLDRIHATTPTGLGSRLGPGPGSSSGSSSSLGSGPSPSSGSSSSSSSGSGSSSGPGPGPSPSSSPSSSPGSGPGPSPGSTSTSSTSPGRSPGPGPGRPDGTPAHPALAVAGAILDEARRRHLPPVNVDFALGLLTTLAGMPRGAGEAIFAVARTAGWLAHAMEEYAHPTRLRLRASYTGPLA